MATKIGDAYFEVDADTSKVDKEFQNTEKSIKASSVGAGAAIGTFVANAAPQLLSAAGDWINLGKEAEIFGKKADVVFGDNSAAVKEWADGINESLGLSDETVVGLAASMGDLLVPLGFTRDAAADMSMEMIDAAGALSAWSGGTVSAAEVSDIMTKAMLGETDGLKQLGISINAAEVEQRALELAQKDGRTAITEQDKAIATQQLIMEKSTDAQTAWTDGTMDAVKQQNEATAAWKDAQVALGQILLPIVQGATAFFVGSLIPALKGIGGAFVTAFKFIFDNKPLLGALAAVIAVVLVPAIIAWTTATWGLVAGLVAQAVAFAAANAPLIAIAAGIAALVAGVIYAYQNFEWFRNVVDGVAVFFRDTVWPILQSVFNWLKDNVPPIFQAIVVAITTAITTIQDVITVAVGIIQGIWETFGGFIIANVTVVWDTLRAVIQAAMDIIRGIIQTVTSLISGDWSGAWEGIKMIFSGVWDGIKGIVQAAVDWIKSTIQAAWDAVGGAVTAAWGGIRDGIANIWTEITSSVSDGVSKIFELIASIPDGVAGAIGDGFSAIWTAFKAVINKVIDGWNSIAFPSFTIGGWDPPGPGPTVPGVTIGGWSPPDIPRLHSGGIFPGGANDEGLAMLQGREMVLTRAQQGNLFSMLNGMGGLPPVQVTVDARGATDPYAVGQATGTAVLSVLAQYTRARG